MPERQHKADRWRGTKPGYRAARVRADRTMVALTDFADAAQAAEERLRQLRPSWRSMGGLSGSPGLRRKVRKNRDALIAAIGDSRATALRTIDAADQEPETDKWL